MQTNIKFSKEEYDYLTKLSIARTGKKNISAAVRILIIDSINKKCKCK